MSVFRIHAGGNWQATTRKRWTGSAWSAISGATVEPAPEPGVTGVRALIEAQLDPANYPGRVFTVGVDHATINGCINLADAASSSTAWSLVMIPPGTYAERVVRPHQNKWTDVRSTTLNPADVILHPADDADDTWEHYGTGGILAGITLRGIGQRSSVHSGEFGRNYDFIYYKVIGEQVGPTPVQSAFSWGLGPGLSVFAYDCHWIGYNDRAVYIHNFDEPALNGNLQPGLVVFDNCTISGTPAGSIAWLIADLDSGQDDRIYIKGGSVAGGNVEARYHTGVTTSSFSGAIDPAITSPVNIATGINITRTLPAELPIPARLA